MSSMYSMSPILPTFLITLVSLVLLILITFSAPFVKQFYFLKGEVVNDHVLFGLWGYCFQTSGICTPKALGYHWDPEFISWMTKVLVFFPIATGFNLLLLIAILPATCAHRTTDKLFPPPLYSLLAIPTAITSLIAFVFMIALYALALTRFHSLHLAATFGPLPWLSLVATILLLGLMFFTGCGSTYRGCCGQLSPHIQDRYDVYSA